LDRKFNDTAAYINMKNIITKKNEQVRELRDRLLIYEKEDDNQDNVVWLKLLVNNVGYYKYCIEIYSKMFNYIVLQ